MGVHGVTAYCRSKPWARHQLISSAPSPGRRCGGFSAQPASRRCMPPTRQSSSTDRLTCLEVPGRRVVAHARALAMQCSLDPRKPTCDHIFHWGRLHRKGVDRPFIFKACMALVLTSSSRRPHPQPSFHSVVLAGPTGRRLIACLRRSASPSAISVPPLRGRRALVSSLLCHSKRPPSAGRRPCSPLGNAFSRKQSGHAAAALLLDARKRRTTT